jgi:phosphatidylserine/phosphatidylglycerophosphate/cardiolipin synthase-like enzyme
MTFCKRLVLIAVAACGCLYAEAELKQVLPCACEAEEERLPRVGEFDTRTAVLITRDGAETTRWKLELLRGREYREALRLMGEAMERNPQLKVHLLYEAFMLDEEDCRLHDQLRQRFPAQFHAVQTAMETNLVENGSTVGHHMKILVVDGKYFVVGGTSLEQTLSTEGLRPEEERESIRKEFAIAGARDMDVIGVGPLAETLRRVYFAAHARFERLVIDGVLPRDDRQLEPYLRYYPVPTAGAAHIEALEQHPDLLHNVPVKLSIGSPFDDHNAITIEYLYLIWGAEKSIEIGNLYFMPVQSIYCALIAAGNRGVETMVTTNGVHKNTPAMTSLFGWGSRLNYLPLLLGVDLYGPDYFFVKEIPANRVRIFEYDVERVLYHKKVMVVDGRTVLIGSYNLGKKSDAGDYELALTIESQAAAEKVHAVLELDRAHSREPSRDEVMEYYFSPLYATLGRTQQATSGFY